MSSEPGLPVITARGLGKRYLIYDKPHHRLLQGLFRRPMHHEFWALRGLDFEVKRGEAIGIIGRNGSGKSTLLQIVCGILEPTEGSVQVRGRVAAMLELGAGFNPEFTGRENVYVSGSLLGISKSQMDIAIEAILDFAEIGEHIDQPVKTYSSGMFVRLAFAVAVHCEPEILVIDEALAVGDVYFQAKCQRRIAELRERGCTLLFVTHSVDALARLCDRGMVLDRGRLVFDGAVKPAVSEYLRRVFGSHRAASTPSAPTAPRAIATGVDESMIDPAERALRWLRGQQGQCFESRPGYHVKETRVGTGQAQVADFAFAGLEAQPPLFEPGDRAHLFVRYAFPEAMERLVFGIQVRDLQGAVIYSTNSFMLDGVLESTSAASERVVGFSFNVALLPGRYYMTLGVSRFDEQGMEIEALDRRIDAVFLTVIGATQTAVGLADLAAEIQIDPDINQAP